MTVQVDDHSLPLAVAAEAAWAADAMPYVHPATRANIECRGVPAFDVVAEPGTGRIDLVGEFDFACGQRFRDASAAARAGGAADVVVDFARVRFIDASGIGLLVELRNELATRGATLRIVNPADPTVRVFSVCGLDAMLTVPGAP